MTWIALRISLLRMGYRIGRGGARTAMLHRVALILAGVVAVGLTTSFLLAQAGYQGRASRESARLPIAAVPGQPIAGYWSAGADAFERRQFSVVYFAQKADGAPPPPGLSSWPAAGQVFLSPALVAADRNGTLRARYGHFAGEIGESGLAGPGEWIVYVGASTTEIGRGTAEAISGFGAPVAAVGSPGYAFMASDQFDRPIEDLLILILVMMALPTAVLLVVAGRVGAEERDRRIALIDSLGGLRKHRRWVVIGECAPWLAVGVVGGAALLSVPVLNGFSLPFAHYTVGSDDARRALGPLVCAVPLVFLAVVLVIAAVHPNRRRRETVRPSLVRPRLAPWRLVVVGAVYALAAWTANLHSDQIAPLVTFAIVGALAVTPLLAGHAAAKQGAWLARRGSQRGRPTTLIGGAWQRARPTAVARLGAGIVIGIALVGQMQVSMSRMSGPEYEALKAQQAPGAQAISIHQAGGLSRGALQRFSALLPGAVVATVTTSDADTAVFSSDCASLRRLGAASCPATPTPAADVLPMDDDWQYVWGGAQVEAAASPLVGGTDQDGPEIVVVTAGTTITRDQVEQAAYATLVDPYLSTALESWLDGDAARDDMAGWCGLVGLIGLLIMLLAAGTSTAATVLGQAKNFGALGGFVAGRRFYRAAAFWSLGVPLTVMIAVAILVDGFLGYLQLLAGAVYGARFDLGVAGWSALVGLLVAGMTTLVGARALRRAAEQWRPTGE